MEVGQLNLETLKSSLLFNFRTGNIAIDTLITGLIICLSTYLINLASKIQNIDYHALFVKLFGKHICISLIINRTSENVSSKIGSTLN